jgi:hypothetical protein
VSAAAPLPDDDSGWYLYGVVAAGSAAAPPAAPAVDPAAPVTAIEEGALAGIASRVSLAEFDEAALPQRLADSAWLEEKIRAHERVLEEVLARTAVVPCRFCTVYRNERELRRFLVERGELLENALGSVEGAVELGVKAFVDSERFAENEPSLRELRESVAGAEGGRAYLESRRLEQRARDELARYRGEMAHAVHARLAAAAEAGVLLDLQRPELSGRDQEMVFNGAYLVRDRSRFERELAAIAEENRARGVEFELTGPWPPYNFLPKELGGGS